MMRNIHGPDHSPNPNRDKMKLFTVLIKEMPKTAELYIGIPVIIGALHLPVNPTSICAIPTAFSTHTLDNTKPMRVKVIDTRVKNIAGKSLATVLACFIHR